MSGHSLFAPSGAARWMRCAGSVAMSHGEPDTANDFTDEGTAAHHLGAVCLKSGEDAANYLWRDVYVFEDGECQFDDGPRGRSTARSFWTVDDEFAGHVQVYLNHVRQRLATAGEGAVLLVEQRVDFSEVVGIPGQGGTGDAVIVSIEHEYVEVIDLKFGRGVQVYASYQEIGEAGDTVTLPNEQLALYWLGKVLDLQLLYDITKAILTIVQPRIGEDGWIDSAPFSDVQMTEFADRAHDAAQAAAACFKRRNAVRELPPEEWTPLLNDDGSLYAEALLNPTKKGCQWCKAKVKQDGTECPKLKSWARDEVMANAEDMTDIDALPIADLPSPEKLDLIEIFYKALQAYVTSARSRIQLELMAGRKVPLWKLVVGKLGARKWKADAEAAVVKQLKKWKLAKDDYMTAPKLVTPPTLEQVLKKNKLDIKQLGEYIEQADAGKHIAPIEDEREEVMVLDVAAQFNDLTEALEENDLL